MISGDSDDHDPRARTRILDSICSTSHLLRSDSSSDYVTDDEYEADFEGKSLERVSQEADFALAEAMKMLEMDDEK